MGRDETLELDIEVRSVEIDRNCVAGGSTVGLWIQNVQRVYYRTERNAPRYDLIVKLGAERHEREQEEKKGVADNLFVGNVIEIAFDLHLVRDFRRGNGSIFRLLCKKRHLSGRTKVKMEFQTIKDILQADIL